MKTAILFTSLFALTITSTKSCEKTAEDYINDFNPYQIAAERTPLKEEITLHDRTVNVEDYSIRNRILKIKTFTYIEENKTETNKSFSVTFTYPGIVVHSHKTMTFYQDGFVDVENKYVKNHPSHYYYQFDSEQAASLYELAEKTYQDDIDLENERNRLEEEYTALVNSFDINDFLTALQTEEGIEYYFYFPNNPTDKNVGGSFEKDETLNNLILNAQYTPTNREFDLSRSNNNYISISNYYDNNLGSWGYALDEGYQMVRIYRAINDNKFSRRFSRELYYTVDRASVQAIMNRALEIRGEMEINTDE